MKHMVLGLAVVAMSGAVFAMPPIAQVVMLRQREDS